MQGNKQPANQNPSASLVPDVVKEIPVVSPNSKLQPVSEDDELDKIMRDVGQNLKQVGQKNPKKHWFNREKKSKAEPKFSARPVDKVKPLPAAPPKPVPQTPGSSVISKPAAAAKTKPVKTGQAPISAVVLALLITAGLITAAYYAYK